MPLFPEYKEQIKGTTGDLLNTGGRAGGSCTAAAFLKEFTGGVPWIHLDIAGTAYTDSEKPYQAKGPSGQIIRTMVDFVIATAAANK
jgi:leucyl aminopeptidase